MTTGRILRDSVAISTTKGRILRDSVTIAGPKGRILRDSVTISTLLTATAGPDLIGVQSFSTFVLDGSLSSGSPSIFNWYQLSGPAVMLTGTGSTRRGVAPATWDGVDLVFGLTVGDGVSTSTPDTLTVSVLPHGGFWAYRGGQLVPLLTDVYRAA